MTCVMVGGFGPKLCVLESRHEGWDGDRSEMQLGWCVVDIGMHERSIANLHAMRLLVSEKKLHLCQEEGLRAL